MELSENIDFRRNTGKKRRGGGYNNREEKNCDGRLNHNEEH